MTPPVCLLVCASNPRTHSASLSFTPSSFFSLPPHLPMSPLPVTPPALMQLTHTVSYLKFKQIIFVRKSPTSQASFSFT